MFRKPAKIDKTVEEDQLQKAESKPWSEISVPEKMIWQSCSVVLTIHRLIQICNLVSIPLNPFRGDQQSSVHPRLVASLSQDHIKTNETNNHSYSLLLTNSPNMHVFGIWKETGSTRRKPMRIQRARKLPTGSLIQGSNPGLAETIMHHHAARSALQQV